MKRRIWAVLSLITGVSLLAAGVLLLVGREHRLALRREISVRLPSDKVWALLEAAFRDSTASPLWPNDLETLHSAGLAAGAQVTATYKTPFGASSHIYTIDEFRAGSGFTYLTGPDHPLQGGGRVLLQPDADGATLIWTVHYTYRGLSPSALFVRLYFAPHFFSRLEANLRALE